jgi:hypothetical protein
MLSPALLLQGVAVGNDAGWTLAFYKEDSSTHEIRKPPLVLSRDDYYAEIEAVLPGDFAPGKYTFVIEGMTDDHYAKIAPGDVVELYLYWRDTNASPTGYLANFGGLTDRLGTSVDALKDFLVAKLVVTKVSRKAGARRYETTIEARERVFVRLYEKTIVEMLSAATFKAAAEALVEGLNISLDASNGFNPDGTLPSSSEEHPGNDAVSFDGGQRAARAMIELGRAIEDVTETYGRGMLLIHDGTLLIGPRPIPQRGRPPFDLSHRNGLIESVLDAAETEPSADDPTKPPPDRKDRYRLTLKGRPDLKPGDVVRFHPAPEDAGKSRTVPESALGAVAASFAGPLLAAGEIGDPVAMYVDSVQHKLGRKSAFATVLTGVVSKDGRTFWDDNPGPGSAPAPGTRGHRGSSPSSAVGTARAIRSVAEDAAAAARAPEVGEVRAANSTSSGDEPPSQTETLWRGLARPDGRGNQARRLDIRRRNPSVFEGVPYTSPFAWGRCGLVLPRYPGTRVLMVHRNGEPRDPVEIGALWESGWGPDSEPGDWWLILPAGLEEGKRASMPDSTERPEDWLDEVTNDLIDADGNRVIEVGELTIRVGTLKRAGVRPERASLEHGVTIEHVDGEAKITIDQDGKIVIEAKADLELVSKEGDIKLTASQGSVDVSVQDAMNVS